jgi:hypothetical protein
MASTDDKITADAQRASGRGPAGYLADRVMGRADFRKAPGVASAPAAKPIPVDPQGADAIDKDTPATRNLRRRIDSQENEALGKTSYKAGGLVRRGYGKARGA